MPTSKFYMDPLIQTLCDRCAELSHRALFVLRGEEITEEIGILYNRISKAGGSEQSSILWCHRKDAVFPKSSRKNFKSLVKKQKSGQLNLSELKPLDILMMSTAVRFCSYSNTHTILGNTYGMCVLQDIECLTPNILCHVVETVRGGGAVVLALNGVTHLRQLANMDMDAHYRLTTHSHPTVNKLFNNRLAISLAWCQSCIILDDELRVCYEDVVGMQYSSIKPAQSKELAHQSSDTQELATLQDTFRDATKPLPQLMGLCKTYDQGQAVVKLVDVLTEQQPGEVVSLTAGRGRGKSAALGLAVAAAIDLGFNYIFVTSPSPHNLTTFFQLLFLGFDALEYKESKEDCADDEDTKTYEIFKSTNPEFSGAIIRVHVNKGNHRQTLQYVEPGDCHKIRQPELVVVDEAAAIPLPQVQSIVGGEHITIMASTVAGYEGTGRSLSLKLIKQLRQQSSRASQQATAVQETAVADVRGLHELTLSSSIRYGRNDPVEEWLYKLLCLSATEAVTPVNYCPAPQQCQLYYVNKSVLLSGNKASEQFLLQAESLLVSSHYRNSPDDLQVLADATAHHLFVLLPPLPDDTMRNLPPVLCVLQVCLEGGIPAAVSRDVQRRGERPSGDLVPWNLSVQYRDPSITQYIGARIIRVATHPDFQSMGYGSRAVRLLQEYYAGRLVELATAAPPSAPSPPRGAGEGPVGPEQLTQPLMCKLSDRLPEAVDYVSVSFGITPQLYKFWAKAKFIALSVSNTVNNTTGEHNCIMVHPVSGGDDQQVLPDWLTNPCAEFIKRFVMLIGYPPLRFLHPMLAYDIIKAHTKHVTHAKELTWKQVQCFITGQDLRRLQKYTKNVVDRRVVTDLVPRIAQLFFCQKLSPELQLSNLQAALLVGSGLQHQDLIDVGAKLDLVPQSALGNFNRAMGRVCKFLTALQESEYTSKLMSVVPDLLVPVDITVDQDLETLAKELEQERPDLQFIKKKKRPDGEDTDEHKRKTKKKSKYNH